MVYSNVVFMWIKQADSLQNLITALQVVRSLEKSGTLDKTTVQDKIMKRIGAKEKRAAQDYLTLAIVTGAVKEDVAKIVHLTAYGKTILDSKDSIALIGKALSSYGPFVWFLRNIQKRQVVKHGEDVAIIGLGSSTNKEHSIDVIRRRRDSFRSWANTLGLIEIRHDGTIRKTDNLDEFLKDSDKGAMQVHSKYIYNPLNAAEIYGLSGSDVSIRRSVILSILQEHGSIAWNMLESAINSIFEYPRLTFRDDVLALQSCGLVDLEDQTIKKYINSTGAATFGRYVIVGRAEWSRFKDQMKQVCGKLNLRVPEYVLGREEEEEVIGEPMQLGVMNYAPTNELGVVAIFVTYRKELGFPILEMIRPQFPDAVVLLRLGEKYVKKYIEFEFKSSGFKKHLPQLTEKKKCHYVVCWEHDWKNCPVPVIELRTQVKEILRPKQI